MPSIILGSFLSQGQFGLGVSYVLCCNHWQQVLFLPCTCTVGLQLLKHMGKRSWDDTLCGFMFFWGVSW